MRGTVHPQRHAGTATITPTDVRQRSRAVWSAVGLTASTLLVAVLPKCPLCCLAYLGVFTLWQANPAALGYVGIMVPAFFFLLALAWLVLARCARLDVPGRSNSLPAMVAVLWGCRFLFGSNFPVYAGLLFLAAIFFREFRHGRMTARPITFPVVPGTCCARLHEHH